MSYLFQSRQLHPRHCSLGMGTVGPEQAWTRETAGKPITDATTSCPKGNRLRRLSEFTVPRAQSGGDIVEDTSCLQTGKIFEARNPGGPRMVEWCCGVTEFKPPRALTQEEFTLWSGSCQPVQDERGHVYETIPGWQDPNRYVKPPCERTNLLDDGYELICCPVPGSQTTLTRRDVEFVQAAPTVEQEAQWEAHRQETELERAQAREAAALAPATLVDRYGLPVLLVGGVVGLGVVAALVKRLSVAKQEAKKAKKRKKSKKRKSKK